jgi:hypothetical protein
MGQEHNLFNESEDGFMLNWCVASFWNFIV